MFFLNYKNYSFPLTKKSQIKIKRQICGFLNSQWCRIFFGISDDKIVNGILITYNQRDDFKNKIINLTDNFYPKCITYIDVNFIPIKNIDCKYIENLYIIKIIVSQGDPKKLYSCTTKGYNSYLRLNGQCIQLTAEEIIHEIFKREKISDSSINPREFQDPIPENPELIKSNEILFDVKKLINSYININKNLYNFSFNINEKFFEYKNNIDEKKNEDDCDNEKNDLKENEEDYKENDLGDNEDDNNENVLDKNEDDYGGDEEFESYEENSKNNCNLYTIKINVTPLTNKPLTIQNVEAIFSPANCKKRFFKKGKIFFGFLSFPNKFDAILFKRHFNYKACSNYQIKLIPK